MDETFVGGKAKNRAHRKPALKKAVVAFVEREGHVRSFPVANVNAKQTRGLIVTDFHRSSHLMTDESMVYTRVGDEFAGRSVVNHSGRAYVTGGGYKHATRPKTSSPFSSAESSVPVTT
ncbi:MAG TPA: transposase [Allosphingosinicella sp.]